MELGLTDRVVLVTGASGGIGRTIASTLATEGATVIAHGLHGFESLRAWCPELGIHPERADLTDPGEVDALFERLLERFGRIDGVAANAGRWPIPDAPLWETSVERLQGTVDACLWTALLTARGFTTALARTGPHPDGTGASLVFTGSTAGRFGEAGHIAYATAKSALVGLTLTLKNEIVAIDPWARVNLVQPGWIATPAVSPRLEVPGVIEGVTRTMPLRRVGSPDDIAQAVTFLLSPVASRHVTGEIFTVAGGMEGRLLWDPARG
ncbi:MAG TPA: SDR family oxidoreductase [Deltaproteobacteria bacterium]|nr:SDR family oxidoreductase [Deltaproteobacteria bacterium]